MRGAEASSSVTPTSTASAAQEATNIYNNYIAAARLCRSGGKRAIEATASDPITAYDALIRAQQTCDESADRISAMELSDTFAGPVGKPLEEVRMDCVRTHRLLARVYGKIAKLIDKGGTTSHTVETRDLLHEGRDGEEYCHLHLAEAVRAVGGEVLDGGVAN